MKGNTVSYAKNNDGDDIPIFEFVTVTREIITRKSLNENSFYKKRLFQNERFDILYGLHNPSEFIVESKYSVSGINLLFILVAFIFVIFGLPGVLHIIHIDTGSVIV